MDRLEAAAKIRKLSEDRQIILHDYLASFLRQRKMARQRSGSMDEYLSTLRKEMAELVIQNIQLMDKLLEVNGTIEYLTARRTNIRNFAVCYTDTTSAVSTPQPSPRVSALISPIRREEASSTHEQNSFDEGFYKEDNPEPISSLRTELSTFLKEFEIDWRDDVWMKDTIKIMKDGDLEDSGVEMASNDGAENANWVNGFASAKTSTL